MTIKDVRRIMGKKVEHLSDEELLKQMVKTDEELEDLFRKAVRKHKPRKSKK